MREVLFRGKKKDDGKWIEGALMPPGLQGESVIFSGASWCDNQEWTITDFDFVDPATVGQYTGLADKNGCKIFEGDIVRYQPGRHPEKLFLVKWMESLSSFHAYPIDKKVDWRPNMNTGTVTSLEIVGNIHDNPELMKGD